MSIVGPRPEVPYYVARWPEEDRKVVLSVKPGITDYATLFYNDEQAVLAKTDDPKEAYMEFEGIDMGRTARELSIEELRTYRPLQALEDYQRDPLVAERRERAWEIARSVAEFLKMRYGAKRVVVFGSLAQKTPFTPWSDIDLAVWGIAPEEYFSAAGAAMDMGLDSGIKVDLIDAETCSPEFQADIEKYGVAL